VCSELNNNTSLSGELMQKYLPVLLFFGVLVSSVHAMEKIASSLEIDLEADAARQKQRQAMHDSRAELLQEYKESLSPDLYQRLSVLQETESQGDLDAFLIIDSAAILMELMEKQHFATTIYAIQITNKEVLLAQPTGGFDGCCLLLELPASIQELDLRCCNPESILHHIQYLYNLKQLYLGDSTIPEAELLDLSSWAQENKVKIFTTENYEGDNSSMVVDEGGSVREASLSSHSPYKEAVVITLGWNSTPNPTDLHPEASGNDKKKKPKRGAFLSTVTELREAGVVVNVAGKEKLQESKGVEFEGVDSLAKQGGNPKGCCVCS